jgi:hypothetical protein
MVIFIISTDVGVHSVWLDHGQAIDEYNVVVTKMLGLGLNIIAENSKLSNTILHQTLFSDNGLVRLACHEIKGNLLQGL